MRRSLLTLRLSSAAAGSRRTGLLPKTSITSHQLFSSSPPPVVDGLLLQLATAANGLALDLILASANQPPTGSVPADPVVLGSPEPAKHQAGDVIPVEAVVASQSPCRSPRIRSAYDGVHIGSVE